MPDMSTEAIIIVWEKECPADDYDTESGAGMPDDVEPSQVDHASITDEDLAESGLSLDDAIQAALDGFGCGQYDGGSTGYDPDGTSMAFNAEGTITERWAHVIRASEMPSQFVPSYIECAFWASTDDDGEPLDQSDAELSAEARASMAEDCFQFYAFNFHDLHLYARTFTFAYAGHDFWLTRNGHGAGFWDRTSAPGDLYDACERLAAAARVYGESDLYIGDDGSLYV